MFLKFCYTLLVLFMLCSPCYALKGSTHEKINYENTKRVNFFDLHNYLAKNLGLTGGVGEEFKSKRVDDWLGSGGRYEDEPIDAPLVGKPIALYLHRFSNHFHQPNLTLSDAGYSGILYGALLDGDSSILWAQQPVGTQEKGGNYSWRDARKYYYDALTAEDPAVRDEMFADTFRSVGQVMHLIEDMSVPAHTRNDGHTLRNYEDRVKELEKQPALFSSLIDPSSENLVEIQNLTLVEPEITGMVPISRLFDRSLYTGCSPLETETSVVALAEFTNANFVSADTIEATPDLPSPDVNGPCVDRRVEMIEDVLNPGC